MVLTIYLFARLEANSGSLTIDPAALLSMTIGRFASSMANSFDHRDLAGCNRYLSTGYPDLVTVSQSSTLVKPGSCFMIHFFIVQFIVYSSPP